MKAEKERIHLKVDESFFVGHHYGRRFHCPYHYHPEAELTLILKGKGQRIIGDDISSFEPGDLVLIGSNLPHSYFQAPGFNDGPRGVGSTYVQFSETVCGGLLTAPEMLPIRKLLQRAQRGLLISGKPRQLVTELLDKMVKVQGWQRLHLLIEILGLLADRGKNMHPLASLRFTPQVKGWQVERLERVCQWITTGYQEELTVQNAAKIANMTPAAFSRFFRRATNRTFVEFVNEVRIGHACRLLMETEYTISRIAMDSGFQNLSNFNRRFLQIKGHTPKDYRKRAVLPN